MLISFDSVLNTRQRELVVHVHAQAPAATIHVRYGEEWTEPAGDGVTFPRRNTHRPRDQHLAQLWQQVPRRKQGFLVAIRKAALSDDARLVVTLGHELEHVRQELAVPGILVMAGLALSFVEQTALLPAELPGHLHFPVNSHAEVAGARSAAELLGTERVRQYYMSERPDVLALVEGRNHEPPNAAADLAAFLARHWTAFEHWYSKTIRQAVPALNEVRAFVAARSSGPDTQVKG